MSQIRIILHLYRITSLALVPSALHTMGNSIQPRSLHILHIGFHLINLNYNVCSLFTTASKELNPHPDL